MYNLISAMLYVCSLSCMGCEKPCNLKPRGELCAGPGGAGQGGGEGRGACWGVRRSCGGSVTALELAWKTLLRWSVEPSGLWPWLLFKTAQKLTEVEFSLGGKCEV